MLCQNPLRKSKFKEVQWTGNGTHPCALARSNYVSQSVQGFFSTNSKKTIYPIIINFLNLIIILVIQNKNKSKNISITSIGTKKLSNSV